MPGSQGRCYRVWNGAGDSAAVFGSQDAVIESVMLPKSLRHRYWF